MKLLSTALAALSLVLAGVCLAAWFLGHIDNAAGLFTVASSLFCAAIARTQPEII